MSVIARLAQRWGGQPWFAVLGRAYVHVDRWIGRFTGGRLVALGQRELPSLLITTTGRTTGQAAVKRAFRGAKQPRRPETVYKGRIIECAPARPSGRVCCRDAGHVQPYQVV